MENEDIEEVEDVNKGNGKCDEKFNNAEAVKFVNHYDETPYNLNANQYFYAKLTGNQSIINLDVASEDPELVFQVFVFSLPVTNQRLT